MKRLGKGKAECIIQKGTNNFGPSNNWFILKKCSIITSTSIWIYDWFATEGWRRQQFAWVSEIDNIKWNNLGIVNPVKYQGMKIIFWIL